MRDITPVVRDAEQLQIRLAHEARTIQQLSLQRTAHAGRVGGTDEGRCWPIAQDCFHATAPSARARGGISCALGCACLSACRQIFTAKTHMASTSATKKPHTTASR